MKQQLETMLYDPATGERWPFPSHADQWREWHGRKAWLFNPWTGKRRSPEDIGDDVMGQLIIPQNEPILGCSSKGRP